MKKNISINLFGTLYAIDEDAYNLLEKYLDAMKSYFSRQEGGDEIADDIEHRVAELLWEEKENGAEAVNIDMIKTIIAKIGDPAQIDENSSETNAAPDNDSNSFASGLNSDDNSEVPNSHPNADGQGGYNRSETSSSYNELRSNMKGRRMYRDLSDKILGGVCSGFSNFVGGDVTLWRLGAVVLTVCFWSIDWWWIPGIFNWFVPLAYLVLWFVVPVAKTPEDRLRMRGQEINPQNINEEILNETDSQANATYNGNYNRGSNNDGCLKLAGGGCLVVLLFPILLTLACFLFFVPLFSGILSGGLFTEGMFGDKLPTLLSSVQGALWTVLLCGFLVCLIPIFLIVRWLRGSSKPLSTTAVVVLFVVWLASLLGGIYFISNRLGNIAKTTIEILEEPVSDIVDFDTTFYGIHYDDQDEYRWIINNNWKILSADNCDRVTLYGEYYYEYASNGEYEEYFDPSDKRYLDCYNAAERMRYTAEQMQCVQPGLYRLRAVTRSNKNGAFIFACVGKSIAESDKILTQRIKPYGNEEGPLWLWAENRADSLEENIPSSFSEIRKQIAEANAGQGYGWGITVIDNIPVQETTHVYYGVTTDSKYTNDSSNCEWFSACDFELERIGDLK